MEPVDEEDEPLFEGNSEVAPHKCPECGGPAYVGGMANVECTTGSCRHFHAKTALKYWANVVEEIDEAFDTPIVIPWVKSID
jgi:hypothetical protein